ncbi:MAG: hypothetical protein DLM69_02020, partial [Candidatus Chloroheliales bacterium]
MQEPTILTSQRELLRTYHASSAQSALLNEDLAKKRRQIEAVKVEGLDLLTSVGQSPTFNSVNAPAPTNVDAIQELDRATNIAEQSVRNLAVLLGSLNWREVARVQVFKRDNVKVIPCSNGKLFAFHHDNDVSVWDSTTLSEIRRFNLRSEIGQPAALWDISSDLRLLVTIAKSRFKIDTLNGVLLYNLNDKTKKKIWWGYVADARRIQFSPSGETILMSYFGNDDKHYVWILNSKDGAGLMEFPSSYGMVFFTPNGERLLKLNIQGLSCYNVHNAQLSYKVDFSASGVDICGSSFDGSTVAFTSGLVKRDIDIGVCSESTEKLAKIYNASEAVIIGLGVSPDGQIISSCEGKGYIRFWSANNGEAVNVLHVEGLGELKGFAFSADWRTMAIGGSNGSVLFMQADYPDLPAKTLALTQSVAAAEFWYNRAQEQVATEHRHTLETQIATHHQQWMSALTQSNQPALHSWAASPWQSWQPASTSSDATYIGTVTPTGSPHLAMPALASIIGGQNLLIEASSAAKATANKAMQSVMLRLLATTPPGKLRFTMIDPVGLGQNFAPFMKLADYDDQLVTGKAWTEPHHIEQRLADLAEHMENVIQRYLRNEYQSIEEYNEKAGEVAEPYRVLAIANFPVNFSEAAARRLVSIAANGPRCGVYVIVTVDTEQPMPHGFVIADLERTATVIKHDGSRFVWDDDDFRDCQLELDSPPEPAMFDRIIKAVGEGAKSASRVEVPFESIAPPPAEWWQANSSAGLSVSIGRKGATGQQLFELGKGTAHHALVVGKTGSGKSTLLHVLITNLALKYSPQEVQLYLIDFKQGVEFKVYANQQLPHARVIAIESEREFGLSVLNGLDVEMNRRGELFRKAGAERDLMKYRQNTRQPCPRILLIVDEFQGFFTEDDSISQQATLLLDRLVRQGRSFGIHVLLSSQTLAGAYSLARSTIDQMGVRIALQCSEADARLIMSDDNPAARLLSRPGEAIYNDANGRVEGNNNFQVVWMTDDVREDYLRRIRQFAADKGNQPQQIVFEGNAPAEVEKNKSLTDLLAAPTWANPPRGISAWLGEPIAIKEPTAATFKRQSGSSLLIVGQNDEAALGMSMTALLSIAAQQPPAKGEGAPGACFYVLDFTPADAPYANLLSRLGEFVPHTVRAGSRRQLPDLIAELAAEVDRRLQTDDTGAYPIYLCIYGLHRARDLRPEEDNFSFSLSSEPAPPSPAKQFPTILREGPELGVHTIVWCDTLANLNRTLDRRALREFEQRVAFQMSAEDSSNLVDSPAASKLGQHRALFFSEEQGRAEKFRPYGLPSEEWLA